ncbi:uncharacterized protein LOC135948858 [Calliphora vicina]|uniref:uncharacterized protein LOC135948858 n=1 Tax=Calliphora vicina TaxID=7373 RepID=UPI00325B86BF
MAKVVANPSGVSECWKYFGDMFLQKRHILGKYKFCKLCFEQEDMILKGFGKSTSTGNYLNHLRSAHNIDAKSANYKKKSIMTENALGTTSTKTDKFQNARRLAEMCCIDLLPFTVVERSGFQKYAKHLNPKICFPSAYTVSSTALNDVYNFYLGNIKDILNKSPNCICLVLDMWSDKHKHLSYINIKVHYCQNLKLEVITLKTEIFPRPHTANAVAEKIEESIQEFNLNNKNICSVTDGGTNIVAALKLKKIQRFGCCAHALHRFISNDVLNNDEIRRLQNLEEQDGLMQFILQAQIILEEQEKIEQYECGDDDFFEKSITVPNLSTLKNSVPTRWNSLLVMLNSFEQNIDMINIAILKLKKENLIIPEMEKEIIKEVVIFLKIFEKATQYLQGQKYPTISRCIYFYEQIMILLEKAQEESCFELTIKLCQFSV